MNKTCIHVGCRKRKDLVLIFNRPQKQLVMVCNEHRSGILHADSPEYLVDCPNCGCEFGVN